MLSVVIKMEVINSCCIPAMHMRDVVCSDRDGGDQQLPGPQRRLCACLFAQQQHRRRVLVLPGLPAAAGRQVVRR